ncbi:hypothetical protein [Burkholderia multivorans]|uniref:hypothetical protein n=1 Tax=Burkholderia multivorans TaxID=87883 RepID=UPI000D464591|nr:hypothetical protein [Burkholderia multivorans]MBU9463609.1 hypothetical protein [Burkholderia multivorans]MBU9512176.1 hypothetical protein [Burkholderia multivorans]MCA8481594.1 hypothetical protein [Burkholderia multivorans]MDN7479028.1 hypothetical protein [Burkholderia multivorans]PRE00857.1 hypothetical protein C6P91_25660 [Burkholderia multivorans]
MKKVLKVTGYACAALFGLMLLVGIFGNTKHKDEATAPAVSVASGASSEAAVQKESATVEAQASRKQDAAQEPEVADNDLDITPDQYAKAFNAIMVNLKEPFRIKPRIEKGESVDTFKSALNENLYVIGSVSKTTGKLRSIVFMGAGDGTVTSGANIIIVSTAALTAAVPNGTTKTVGPIVVSLMSDFDEKSGKSASKILNNVKLWHTRSEQMGAWFGAEPA